MEQRSLIAVYTDDASLLIWNCGPAPDLWALNLGQTTRFQRATTGSGAVAHLGERFVRIEEVGGSNPPSSTRIHGR